MRYGAPRKEQDLPARARDSVDGGSQSLVSFRIRHPVFPASCQLPVSGSLLSVQISGAYPYNTPVAQCPPCLTRERSEQVSTQCAEEGRRVAGCIVSERGKQQRETRAGGYQQTDCPALDGLLLPVRGPGELRNAAREGGWPNKELTRNPQPRLIVLTGRRNQITKSRGWMGLLGHKTVSKQQKWPSRIRSVARAAQGKWYLTESGHVQPPPPFQSPPTPLLRMALFNA